MGEKCKTEKPRHRHSRLKSHDIEFLRNSDPYAPWYFLALMFRILLFHPIIRFRKLVFQILCSRFGVLGFYHSRIGVPCPCSAFLGFTTYYPGLTANSNAPFCFDRMEWLFGFFRPGGLVHHSWREFLKYNLDF